MIKIEKNFIRFLKNKYRPNIHKGIFRVNNRYAKEVVGGINQNKKIKTLGMSGILKKAEEIENNSNQLLNFTNIIKQKSIDIKKEVIEHLWKVIISDNTVDQYESNLMRRICGLIYFPDKECAEIKLNLLNLKYDKCLGFET